MLEICRLEFTEHLRATHAFANVCENSLHVSVLNSMATPVVIGTPDSDHLDG